MAAQRKGKVGGMRPGAGRKPKPREERQSHHLMVTLTEAEHAVLSDAARGAPLGTFARAVLLRSLARRRK